MAPILRFFLVCVGLELLAGPLAAAVGPAGKRRLDQAGDPLPLGVRARLGTLRFRFEGILGGVALSSDGRSLAVGQRESVLLVDASTGKIQRTISLSVGSFVTTLAFSPDGKLLAGRGSFNPIRIWQTSTGRELRRLEGCSRMAAKPLAFSLDGKWLTLASGSHGQKASALVWDVATGKRKRPFEPLQSDRVGAALSPNGKLLATWGQQWLFGHPPPKENPARLVNLWEVRTGKAKQDIALDNVHGVESAAFSPDGKQIAFSTGDRLLIAAVGSDKQIASLPTGQHSETLIWSADGKHLAACGMDGRVVVWQPATGKQLVERLAPHPTADRRVSLIAFTLDGRILAATPRTQSIDLWDVLTGKLLSREEGHHRAVSSVAFSADGKSVVSTDGEQVCFWNRAGKPERQIELKPDWSPRPFLRSVLAHDGRLLYQSQFLGSRLIESATGKEFSQWGGILPRSSQSAAFAPDGKQMAFVGIDESGGKRQCGVRLLEIPAGRARFLEPLDVGQPAGTTCLAFSRDGKRLAVARDVPTKDRHGLAIGLLDVSSGKESWKISRAGWLQALAFAPHGRLIAVADQTGLIRLLEADTGRLVRSFSVRNGTTRGELAFSPDGRTLAVAVLRLPGGEGSVQLWEVVSGRLRREYLGHRSAATAVAFAPDGQTLAAGATDTTVLLWDVARTPPGKGGELAAEELNALWADLDKEDAAVAGKAIDRLAATPSTLEFSRKNLRPVPRRKIDPRTIERWIEQLDDDDFATRQKATHDLEGIDLLN